MVYAERGVITGGGAWAHALRGRCNFELRRYAEAEEDFRRAVLDDPSLIEARGAIGQLRAMEGDWTNAAEAFRAVLARDPSNAAARENLNRVEARMGAEQRRTEGRQSPAAPR
jgi:cytochrome c-type biogenesis protein CcmH/NrfG